MKKVLVCGGRTFSNKKMFEIIMRKLLDNLDGNNITIIHGCAKGADTMAGEWARENNIQVEEYPADWDKYGKAAGAIRNQQMLDEGKPDLVIAFPGGSGTADMIKRTKKAEIRVLDLAEFYL